MAFRFWEGLLTIRIAVMVGYLGVLLGIGFLARARSRRSDEDYFLASRTLPGWILFLTMAATNFSAFTVFGFSGSGWSLGYGFYPIMAFGTGFMAVAFAAIGLPAWHAARSHGAVTPPELVFRLTGNRGLRLTFFLVMTMFTLPYLAMQPMAAGYALQSLLGIPYIAGAAVITAVMLFYTFLGGFRGVAWTDIFQGAMMIVLLVVALLVVASPFGGVGAANQAVAAQRPELFARPGLGATLTPGVWFGYMLLWLLCDPMFPQLFQRFFAARDPRALVTTMTLYPLITGALFLLPVTIGVIGRLAFPTLPSGTAPDQILPLLLQRFASPGVEALILTAALAALMSTLDSQLLTLSSMFVRDVAQPIYERWSDSSRGRRPTLPPWTGKLFVAALALGGFGLAIRPPATFLEIATETFTGLAVLLPVTVGAIYSRRMNPRAAIAAIAVGEGLVGAYHFRLLSSFGTLPVVPVVVATSFVLIVGSVLFPLKRAQPAPQRDRRRWRPLAGWSAALTGLFVLGNDIWNWGDGRPSALGFPWWIWYFAGLCILLAGLFAVMGRRHPLVRGASEEGTDGR
jgi:SSS family solute:Na+ symporter